MSKTYYNKKYFQDRFEGQKCMAYSIAKFLEKNKVKNVLDVGCGSGWLVKYLNQKGFKVYGCDNAREAILLAKKTAGSSFLIRKAQASKLPYKNSSFDAVLGISIIEHLTKTETDQFLAEACRILIKGGWIFLVTPNLATPLRFYLGKKWGGYSDPTHINLYTPGKLKKTLKRFHFSNIKLTFPYFPDIPFDFGFPKIFFKMPPSIKNLINFLIVSTPCHYFRHSFWLAAQKTKD